MNKLFSFGKYNLGAARSLGKYIILYQYQKLCMAILAIGLLIVLLSMGFVFFQSPSAEELSASSTARSLNTEAIDQLELWLENRQNAYQDGLNLTGRQYFARPLVTP